MAEGALAGINVVELGQLVSAPYCGKLFSDFGARVVKVEPPDGDQARRWGPFPDDEPHPEKSGLFQFLNTNKLGVTLDVDADAGREAFLGLVAGADVLIENNPPALMRARGLDFATLAEVNPDLVMISITPFGQTGPYSSWHGYDLNAFHLSAAGHRYCGRPGEAPLEHGTFSADFYGAATAAAWGLASVIGREVVGGGQLVDVSCAEAVAATFVGGQTIGGYAQNHIFDSRSGIGMGLSAPAAIVACQDGHVWMLVLETGQWRSLVRAMGDPEWAQLDMFDDMVVRGQNKDLIYTLVGEWAMQRGKMEIMACCQAEGAPVTAVLTVGEAAELEHLRERGYLIELEHPVLGTIGDLGAPFKLPASPGGPRTGAPLLGEHNDLVLGDREPGREVAAGGGRAVLRGALATSTTIPATARPAGDDAVPKHGAPAPLEGVRVANFGWVWAGPMVGQTLAFLGAEVYKIESQARLDMSRTIPPFAEGIKGMNRSLSHHAGWAGNGSVTLNLKTPEGLALARQLIAECDVVIENFSPGVMERFGMGYQDLVEVKSDIIMFSMPAAGLTGPMRSIRTYGMSLASLTGLDSITGYVDGPPIPMENAYSDPYNGIMGAYSILVALQHRRRTGEGQHIDYSQQEAVMQLVGPAFMDYAMNGRVGGPLGNRHPLGAAAPHGVFPCAGDDRWVSIVVTGDEEWNGLVAAGPGTAWATDPRFARHADRLANIEDLHDQISSWTVGFDDRDLAARLQGHGVAAAPVLNVGDLLDDPHYRARGTFVEVHHPAGFDETIYGAYVKTSRTTASVEPGPVLGRDNEHVFLDLLGMARDRFDQLVDDQVIY
jgi:benzylsuccinate CoA-transferase BbsF subunit